MSQKFIIYIMFKKSMIEINNEKKEKKRKKGLQFKTII